MAIGWPKYWVAVDADLMLPRNLKSCFKTTIFVSLVPHCLTHSWWDVNRSDMSLSGWVKLTVCILLNIFPFCWLNDTNTCCLLIKDDRNNLAQRSLFEESQLTFPSDCFWSESFCVTLWNFRCLRYCGLFLTYFEQHGGLAQYQGPVQNRQTKPNFLLKAYKIGACRRQNHA